MGYELGVDLGSSFVAAAARSGSRVEMIALGEQAMTIPAVVFVGADGAVLAGDAAARRAVGHPDRAACELKRRLGGAAPVRLGETAHAPAALLGELLRVVMARVVETTGAQPDRVVLTHPAHWSPARRTAFGEAVRHAGLTEFRTVTEPEAVAAHYAATLAGGEPVAVYDLGGDTFDATVVRRQADHTEILGLPEGVERLGGGTFDEAILAHVNQAVGGSLAGLDRRDPQNAAALARLRQECALAKETLSVETAATIPVLLPNGSTEVVLTRAEFEEMIHTTVQTTVVTLLKALQSAQVEPRELAAVLLVGESARIPLVAKMISDALARPVVREAHPKYPVALGAVVLPGVPVVGHPAPADPELPTQRVGSPGAEPQPIPRKFLAATLDAEPAARNRPVGALAAIGARARVRAAAAAVARGAEATAIRVTDEPAAGHPVDRAGSADPVSLFEPGPSRGDPTPLGGSRSAGAAPSPADVPVELDVPGAPADRRDASGPTTPAAPDGPDHGVSPDNGAAPVNGAGPTPAHAAADGDEADAAPDGTAPPATGAIPAENTGPPAHDNPPADDTTPPTSAITPAHDTTQPDGTMPAHDTTPANSSAPPAHGATAPAGSSSPASSAPSAPAAAPHRTRTNGGAPGAADRMGLLARGSAATAPGHLRAEPAAAAGAIPPLFDSTPAGPGGPGRSPAFAPQPDPLRSQPAGPAPQPTGAVPPTPPPPAAAGSGRPRRTILLVAAALALAAVLGGAGYLISTLVPGSPVAAPAEPPVGADGQPVAASIPVPKVDAVVPVDRTPGFVVVSPDGRRALVAHQAAMVITAVDTATNTVTATIPVPAGPPQYLTFSPDGRRVYVSIWDQARTVAAVAVLDTGTNAIMATIPVRTRPYLSATTPDGQRLYVPNHDSGTISVIDTGTNTVTSEIKVAPNPHWVEMSADGTRAYAANHESNVVSVIDTADDSILAEVPVQTSPHSVAVHPIWPMVANVNYDARSVSVIDTNTDRVVATIPVGTNPQDITWAPDGRHAYVVNTSDDTLSVIDGKTATVTATVRTGDSPTSVAVLPDGSVAYVSNLADGTLSVLRIGG